MQLLSQRRQNVPVRKKLNDKDKATLRELCRKTYPHDPPARVAAWLGQLWHFLNSMREGDWILMPRKKLAAIAIGQITGGYRYRPELGVGNTHTRAVKWLREDTPRPQFDGDIRNALSFSGTMCAVKVARADERLEALVKGEPPPSAPPGKEIAGRGILDIEQLARDQITAFVAQKYKRHELATLVEAILQADGYLTSLSPPGPDGGVDVLAAPGRAGFDSPRICVQVKSSASPVDVKVLRELQGTMQKFKAECGLLVSWGGFTSKTIDEAKLNFFAIRLWDSGGLLEALLQSYDKLPAKIQAELPLKRIWSLVPEEDTVMEAE